MANLKNNGLTPWNISESFTIPKNFCCDVYDIASVLRTSSWAVCSLINSNFDGNTIEPICLDSVLDSHLDSFKYEYDKCSQIHQGLIDIFLLACREGLMLEEVEDPDYIGAVEDFELG